MIIRKLVVYGPMPIRASYTLGFRLKMWYFLKVEYYTHDKLHNKGGLRHSLRQKNVFWRSYFERQELDNFCLYLWWYARKFR